MNDTPETNNLLADLLSELGTICKHNCPERLVVHARKLERERDEAQERECAAIESWWEEHQRALREGQRVVEAMEQNAKLRDIAEMAINFGQYRAPYFAYPNPTWEKMREQLNQIKEGAQ